MSAADAVIFAFGVFATLLLTGGVALTVREFKAIDKPAKKNPDRRV